MRLFLFTVLTIGLSACSGQIPFNESAIPVFPTAETTPVQSNEDAADDPAIWINTVSPEKSLILGTDKKNGLTVYDLTGQQVQFLPQGRLNNVDLRQDVLIESAKTTLVAATNRTTNTLDIFTISAEGNVSFLLAQPLNIKEPYGICMSQDTSGNAYAFINDKNGEYQQWHLNPDEQLKPTPMGSFKLASQPEGCVVHDATQTLYLGEENVGIWTMPADATRSEEMILFDDVHSGHLVADVEGMDIYSGSDGNNWLIVSSQGDYSYAVYDLNKYNSFLGSIRVTDNLELGIDGSEETDGLAVTATNLGGAYSKGLLVVQDGYNKLPKENQNFKLVSWQKVMDALTLN